MKIIVNDDVELKKKSRELDIPFPNLLRGYVIEDYMRRLVESEYKDYLWLGNAGALGLDSYREAKREQGLFFYYQKSSRKIPPEKLVAGQTLSVELMQQMFDLLYLPVNPSRIRWEAQITEKNGLILLSLTADYQGMKVPLTVRVTNLEDKNQMPERGELTYFMNGRVASYWAYSPENALCHAFYKVMDRLELIDSMESYATLNRILKTQAVSGRHVVEEMLDLSAGKTSFLKEKRMEQIAGYREYAYMRKRWEQYCKKEKLAEEPWEEVLDRILAFAKPIWKALVRNEIFFDDWMPELGRFLG